MHGDDIRVASQPWPQPEAPQNGINMQVQILQLSQGMKSLL